MTQGWGFTPDPDDDYGQPAYPRSSDPAVSPHDEPQPGGGIGRFRDRFLGGYGHDPQREELTDRDDPAGGDGTRRGERESLLPPRQGTNTPGMVNDRQARHGQTVRGRGELRAAQPHHPEQGRATQLQHSRRTPLGGQIQAGQDRPISARDLHAVIANNRQADRRQRRPNPTPPIGILAAKITGGITLLWVGLAMALAIGGQLSVGASPDWRVGLVLAAITFGGEVKVQTHHWALGIGVGPLLPALLVGGAWIGAWRWALINRATTTGQLPGAKAWLWAGGSAMAVHLALLVVSLILGSMTTWQTQGIWISTQLSGIWTVFVAFPILMGVLALLTGPYVPYEARRPLAIMGAALAGMALLLTILGTIGGIMAGLNGLLVLLTFPVSWATSLGLASGAPLWLELASGASTQHVGLAITGVQGTVPITGVPILLFIWVIAAMAVSVWTVRTIIITTQHRLAGLWAIGLLGGLILIGVTLGQLSVSNLVAQTTPPPLLAYLGGLLHNALGAEPGATWTLSFGVHWPIALLLGGVVMASAYGLGLLLAGPVNPTWSGRGLERALRDVYQAGLIDQTTYDLGQARLARAKRQAVQRR